MKKAMKVSEKNLLKALSTLEAQADETAETEGEEEVAKGGDNKLPKTTKGATKAGALGATGGEGEEADVSAGAEDESAKSTTADDEDGDDTMEKASASDEETSDEESSEESDDETSKSLRTSVEEDETLSKAIEVSDFLEHLVDQTTGSVDGLRKSLGSLTEHVTGFNARLAKALVAVSERLVRLEEKLDSFGDEAPAGPRSQMEKSLGGKGGAAVSERFEEEGTTFSKSDALDVLVDLVGKGKIHPAVVSQYEVTNTLPTEIQKMVEGELSRRG